MAAVQGSTVWNRTGSERTFSSDEDASRCYALLCDYEAFLEDLVARGKIEVKDHSPQPWETTKG
jgi:hypothetical protein